MKNLLYFLLFTFFVISSINAQTINETEIFKNTSGTNMDPYGIQYDNSGNWAFIQYDYTDPNISRAKIVSNKFATDWLENLNDIGKFDKHGNLYSTTYKLKSDGSYETEYYTLLINGIPFGNYDFLDNYNAVINSNGDYEFIYSKDGIYYIGKMSNGSLVQSMPYKMVKYTFKSEYGNSAMGEGEGRRVDEIKLVPQGEGMPGDELPVNDIFYRDGKGNVGYILVTDNGSNIKFGDNIIETSFPDINESSFQNDNNNEMVFIGKDRTEYSYSGLQTIVMKNNKYRVRGMITTPLIFMSDNTPVYSVMDSLNENTYYTKVYIGDKEYPVYRDAARTKKILGFNSGITDLAINNGKIIFTGINSTQGKKSEQFPEGEYLSKGSLVIDGVMGNELENLSLVKRSYNGKYLYSYMPNHNKVQYGLYLGGMSDPERVIDKGYDYFTDYDFISGSDNYYAVASKDGDYDKGIPGRSFVYLNNKLVGESELISSGNSLEPDNYGIVRFAPNGDYAFGGGISRGDNWIYNVFTKNGIAKVDKSNAPGLSDFNSVDYVYFTPSSKLFFLGMVNTSTGTDYTQKNYLVYDGKVLDKFYDNVQDLVYNKKDNSLTFKGFRDNVLYNVKVSL
ncbi:hypothetical protein BH10BAC5_BH10BAC5_07380 [soil metagenome]